jgi:hypothetical protein
LKTRELSIYDRCVKLIGYGGNKIESGIQIQDVRLLDEDIVKRKTIYFTAHNQIDGKQYFFFLFLDFLTLEDGTDTLSQNVGKQLPHNTALYPRRVQISSTSQQKPEITEHRSQYLVFCNADRMITVFELFVKSGFLIPLRLTKNLFLFLCFISSWIIPQIQIH